MRLITAVPLLFFGLTVNASAQDTTLSAKRAYQEIYQEKSLYRNIVVAEHNGLRCMQFNRNHFLQTCIDTKNPARLVLDYTHAVMASLYLTPKPESALVIGLGGGSIPTALRTINQDMLIHTVELDPAVISVASNYFGFTQDTRSQAFDGDARTFVRKQIRSGIKYDLIIIDAFERDYIPEHLLTREFLTQVKQILNPGGTLAANTFTNSKLTPLEAATYQSVFGTQVHQLEVESGNRIIFAVHGDFPPSALIQVNAEEKEPLLLPLGVVHTKLLPRMVRQPPPPPNTKVLTDQYSPINLLQVL